MKNCWIVALLSLVGLNAFSQLPNKKDSSDLTFKGTRISPYSVEYDTTGQLDFSGYIDTYYAHYSDQSGDGGFQKFPSVAPRNNQFGLNLIQFGVKYQSQKFRGLATLFWGDTPLSAWSPDYSMIQEAHLGFRLKGKLWLDAGFFRTHIGLESIQPRENITMSIATSTYFEPYYLSGAKLTWEQSSKWMFQLNAFNGFNNFVDNNTTKAVGASTSYTPSDKLNITASTLFSDESPTGKPDQLRNYNNLILVRKTEHWTLGIEGNYGFQLNSKLSDSTQTANVMSAIIAAKYRITPSWAVYGRGEYFSDPDEVLTGPVINQNHELVGLDIVGATLGGEYKPIPNSYFRLEGRVLQTKETEKVFLLNNQVSNLRYEVIAGIGVWF